MSHHFFCEFTDQALRLLIIKVAGLAGIIVLVSYLF